MPIVRTETEDGEEVELDVGTDALDLKDDEDPTDLPGVQEEINRVAGKTRKQAKKTAEKQLKDDDEHWRQMAQRRGVDLREEDLMPKGASKGEVKELKKELAQAKQKAERADELEKQIEKTRDTRLENEILQHAGGVEEDMKDLFLSDAKNRFTYDEDDDAFYPATEGGEPDYTRSTEDVISEIQEERPTMFKDRSAQDGPSDEPSDTPSPAEKVTREEYLSKAETMSEKEFSEWSEDVEITDQ